MCSDMPKLKEFIIRSHALHGMGEEVLQAEGDEGPHKGARSARSGKPPPKLTTETKVAVRDV